MKIEVERAPCVVNKFSDEADACEHARAWSKERRNDWVVIHAPSSTGLAFFVEEGDGGMISTMRERLVASYTNGKRLAED